MPKFFKVSNSSFVTFNSASNCLTLRLSDSTSAFNVLFLLAVKVELESRLKEDCDDEVSIEKVSIEGDCTEVGVEENCEDDKVDVGWTSEMSNCSVAREGSRQSGLIAFGLNGQIPVALNVLQIVIDA